MSPSRIPTRESPCVHLCIPNAQHKAWQVSTGQGEQSPQGGLRLDLLTFTAPGSAAQPSRRQLSLGSWGPSLPLDNGADLFICLRFSRGPQPVRRPVSPVTGRPTRPGRRRDPAGPAHPRIPAPPPGPNQQPPPLPAESCLQLPPPRPGLPSATRRLFRRNLTNASCPE